jgi:hypothetical protein
MTQYTALQRTSRQRRSLSRHTLIVLAASFLVPASLLVIARTPVHAASSNNPIFATIQDVQNAINAALAPIQSTIADLQTQQANQATQISNLQSASNKALHVYNANGQDLGISTFHSGAANTIYSPTLQRFIYLYFTDSSIDGDFNTGATGSTAYYQSTDCTGTPYTLPLFANPDGWTSDLIPVSPQAFYIIPDHAPTTTVSINSALQWDTSSHQSLCHFYSLPNTQAYQLQTVSLPFTTPLALPLQFKYQ